MHCAHVPNVNHILHTTNTKPNCPYQELPASFKLLLQFFNRAPSTESFRETLRSENSPTSVTLGKLDFVVSHPFRAQTTLQEVNDMFTSVTSNFFLDSSAIIQIPLTGQCAATGRAPGSCMTMASNTSIIPVESIKPDACMYIPRRMKSESYSCLWSLEMQHQILTNISYSH